MTLGRLMYLNYMGGGGLPPEKNVGRICAEL